ncbi:HDL514Wp [Eremothecium sinecaudum]|uniref:HDL514Wp n=1 Tax=Eremothecium sinecaudum TaxID=45286 RepID=A0A0X8HRQ2_9SACH|nr:HDL514Wp [Eremothecium sinecaudum]AMD20230.1 HDL514Wp [Eremothecium sinecaudum]
MVEEISLSLNETNKIRQKLGLPLIPANEDTNSRSGLVGSTELQTTSDKSYSARYEDDFENSATKASNNAQKDVRDSFVDDRALRLRQRIMNRRGRRILYSSSEDWLENIHDSKGDGTGESQSTLSGPYDERSDGSLLKVAHNVDSLSTGKNIILTLKETAIDDEDEEDILENVNLKHEQEDLKNLKLKQLNKDRKHKAGILNKAVLEEQDEEEESFYLSNRDNLSKKESNAQDPILIGKRKVELEEQEEISEGDYMPAKIKKRKTTGRRHVRTPREQTAPIAPVTLIDEDGLLDYDEDRFHELLTIRKQTKEKKELLEKESLEEKQEKQHRAKYIDRLQKGIVLDETDTFLASLKTDIITAQTDLDIKEEETMPDAGDSIGHGSGSSFDNVSTTIAAPRTSNFYDGIASTLGLLKDKNLIPSAKSASTRQEARKRDLLKLEQKIAVREIKEKLNHEMSSSGISITEDVQEKVEQYMENQIAKTAMSIQKKRLENYNPEVELKYQDEKGNQLTTKEAYKKISQAWHGTKSNKKKRESRQRKIEERNRQNNQLHLGL